MRDEEGETHRELKGLPQYSGARPRCAAASHRTHNRRLVPALLYGLSALHPFHNPGACSLISETTRFPTSPSSPHRSIFFPFPVGVKASVTLSGGLLVPCQTSVKALSSHRRWRGPGIELQVESELRQTLCGHDTASSHPDSRVPRAPYSASS